MGRLPFPKPPTRKPTCIRCMYFQQKWKSEYIDWGYCDYQYRDTSEGSPCCDKFQKKLSKVESNGKN